MNRCLTLGALLLALSVPASADEVLVLKDGRRFTVTLLQRRGDKVRLQLKDGRAFEVAADQVASPPLDSIPEAGAAPASEAPASAGPTTLVLKDGRRFEVSRLERRGDRVRLQLPDGRAFEVPAAQVVSPPLDSIPEAGAAPSSGPEGTGPTTLVLKDGRRIPVQNLGRKGGFVLLQTAKGESFQIPEGQVVEPALDSIPVLGRSTPAPPSMPEAPPEPETPATPPSTEPAPEPSVPEVPLPDFVPIRDRWQIDYPDYPGRTVKGTGLDPYNQNILKGDKPIAGDVFAVFTGILDTPTEYRRVPTAGGVSTSRPSAGEFLGDGTQFFTTPRATASIELFKGQTAFQPKRWALKATGIFNVNYLKTRENRNVDVDVREGQTRRRQKLALEEAFGEVLLASLSKRYDTLSLRVGIQPFVSDFRGLVFSDFNLGARLFGDLANNRWQYNVAYFDLLEKDTNSELNTFAKRDQKVAIVNVFRQDTFRPGYTLQGSFHYSKDEGPEFYYDENGFLVRPAAIGVVRPHEIKSYYVGVAGDGHLGRLNLSHATYYAWGKDEGNGTAGSEQDISAFLGALELSVDRDWVRFRAAAVIASGDGDPGDEKAKGFDTIYDASNFAGGPFSFWSRSAIPLVQTAVLLKTPGSLLPSLRSSKFEGQQSFVNPGLILINGSMDAELTPKLKLILNANYLRFQNTAALERVLFQPDIRSSIGIDLGAGFLYRPDLNENLVITGGITGLLPGAGFEDLYSSPCSVATCGAENRQLFNTFLSVKLTF